jgi:hypothetical protein
MNPDNNPEYMRKKKESKTGQPKVTGDLPSSIHIIDNVQDEGESDV